jgi:ABC-2 type transport system ATP-binding protein
MRNFARSGKTVVFATHYLEEADAFADRIILMARGRIVADGPTGEIKARVGMRTIRATLPDASADGLDRLPRVSVDQLGGLPGVAGAELHGETAIFTCTDSDTALRALLARFPAARDIEVLGANLETAFLALTGDEPTATTTPTPIPEEARR